MESFAGMPIVRVAQADYDALWNHTSPSHRLTGDLEGGLSFSGVIVIPEEGFVARRRAILRTWGLSQDAADAICAAMKEPPVTRHHG